MRRVLKVLVILAGVYLLLIVGSGLALKTMMSGDRVRLLAEATGKRMPVPLLVSDGSFDLTGWLLLHPSVRISGVRIGNPEGFSSEPMVYAREASADVRLLSLFDDKIAVDELRLLEPVLTIEQSRSGRTNIEKLLEITVPDHPPAAPPAGEERQIEGDGFSIGVLAVDKGKISYKTSASPGFLIEDIDITVTGFASDTRFDLEVDAQLFGGSNSELSFTGQAGPLTKTSFPANGDLEVVLAPDEMPREWREEHLGDFLQVSGSGSRVHYDSRMSGDLLRTFRGDGEMRIDGLYLGTDEANRLALSGQAPFELTFREPLSDPGLEIEAAKAALSLGDGTWKGNAAFVYHEKQMRGEVGGAIRGVRVEQLLNAFAGAGRHIAGVADIPDFRLRFAGRNAGEIRESLEGGGTLLMPEGKVEVLDLVAAIEQHAKAILSGETRAEGATDFLNLATSFDVRGQRLTFPDLRMETRSSSTGGAGYVTFEGGLHFDLLTTVRGNLAQLLRGRPDSSGQPAVRVPVIVRGTLEHPKAAPDIEGMAIRKAFGFLEQLLRKGEDQQKEEPRQ